MKAITSIIVKHVKRFVIITQFLLGAPKKLLQQKLKTTEIVWCDFLLQIGPIQYKEKMSCGNLSWVEWIVLKLFI